MIKSFKLVTITSSVLLTISSAFAAGRTAASLSGKYLLSGAVGVSKFGNEELRSTYDTPVFGSVGFNLPIQYGLDVGASIGGTTAKGEFVYFDQNFPQGAQIEIRSRQLTLSTGALLYRDIFQSLRPFLGASVGYTRISNEYSSPLIQDVEIKDSDISGQFSVGIEYLASESVSIAISMFYNTKQFANDFKGVSAGFRVWPLPDIFLSTGATYFIDSEDINVGVGVGLAF
jgi:hypothetical protein